MPVKKKIHRFLAVAGKRPASIVGGKRPGLHRKKMDPIEVRSKWKKGSPHGFDEEDSPRQVRRAVASR